MSANGNRPRNREERILFGDPQGRRPVGLVDCQPRRRGCEQDDALERYRRALESVRQLATGLVELLISRLPYPHAVRDVDTGRVLYWWTPAPGVLPDHRIPPHTLRQLDGRTPVPETRPP